jgi:predicted DNA-binding transcriptional regulator AlpA
MSRNGLLKMKELAEASGVSAGTIKHYLREGLLPEPVKTSRNMAYYPPEFVERIKRRGRRPQAAPPARGARVSGRSQRARPAIATVRRHGLAVHSRLTGQSMRGRSAIARRGRPAASDR